MKYDIVPKKNKYRGMGRTLLATELLTKKSKAQYDEVMDEYYNYIIGIQEDPSEYGLKNLIRFCKYLKNYDIECEIIIYDTSKIMLPWDISYELLGIDIVHDMSESLLSESVNKEVTHFLNENGLCILEGDVKKIINLLDHGNVKWEPCYVYKVIMD